MKLDRSETIVQNDRSSKKPQRRRPGEPQREQKEATRKKLLEAAHAVFERYSYNLASVDMIADEAGVSRTTYYRHFDGKLPIALALFADMVPKLHNEWKDILSRPNPSRADVEAWVLKQVEIIEADRVLNSVLRQVEAIEPDVQSHRQWYYETIMEMIWPKNQLAATTPMAELHAKSILLLLQIDQFLYLFGTYVIQMDRDAIMKAMGEWFYDFLQLRRRELSRDPKASREQD